MTKENPAKHALAGVCSFNLALSVKLFLVPVQKVCHHTF